ncbi:MAG: TRAP transporter small permease [Deltaproteobacteria bacterium]|nr:TRAP transporter small permease [Deltaproteobacteria bacterium]
MVTVERFLNNVAGGIILTAMMLLVTADVLARYLFNSPIHGTTELTEFMMIGLFYFTLAYTQALKAHIRVDMLISLFSPRARLICEEITYLLGFALFALITWQTMEAAVQAWKIWETTFGLILFPLFPAKVLIPIGCFIVCLRLILDFLNGLRSLLKDESP